MLLITGHSSRLDGICLMADTEDRDEAIKMMCDAWNAQFAEGMVSMPEGYGPAAIVSRDDHDYLIFDRYNNDEYLEEIEEGNPGHEGFVLEVTEMAPGKVARHMPW